MIYFYLLILAPTLCSSKTEAVVKANCDCRDWYGRCKVEGDKWVDDETWSYHCSTSKAEVVGCVATDRANKKEISANGNETINGFWFSCQVTDDKVRYEQEPHCSVNGTEYHVGNLYRNSVFQHICLASGTWVTGCFYKDETEKEVLLNVGESAYVGLIQHHCDRFVDYPGRVQYYTSVRDNVTIATPTGVGKNHNLPENITNILPTNPVRWLPENVDLFIANDGSFDTKIRYLRPSVIGD
uniref:Uncharacterized protein n=1 Tax=Plectus sambesii TaxID=2011161 RepID=A0A914WGM4_9BILA